MKRYFIALLAGSLVFATVLGSAAALDVNSAPVQVGVDSDLTCDDEVTIDGYFPDTEFGGAVSNGVVVSDIAEACFGHTIVAAVADGDGNQLARGAVTIGSTTETIGYNLGNTSQVPLEDIEQVQIVIG